MSKNTFVCGRVSMEGDKFVWWASLKGLSLTRKIRGMSKENPKKGQFIILFIVDKCQHFKPCYTSFLYHLS